MQEIHTPPDSQIIHACLVIDPFDIALDAFKKTGRFELSNATLSVRQLLKIKDYLIYQTKHSPTPLIPYQFHLQDVEIALFDSEKLGGKKQRVLTGGVVEDELPSLLRGRSASFSYAENRKESLWLSYIGNTQLKMEEANEMEVSSKTILLNLFEQAKWDVIKLENVVIDHAPGKKYALDVQFIVDLYDALSPTAKKITELSLKEVDLSNHNALFAFLEKADQLKIFRLEDCNQSGAFLKALCEVLANHPTLTELDLGKRVLDEAEYQALCTLSDTDFQLNKISVARPAASSPQNAVALYQKLSEQKSGFDRFKERHLTVENIYKLAEVALQSDPSQFLNLVSSTGNAVPLSITWENPVIPKNYLRQLPTAFRFHPQYTKACFPIQLDIHQRLENHMTIGASLLEKAFALKKPEQVQLLLAAGADLFEKKEGAQKALSLVQRMLADKAYHEIISAYVTQDLSVFVPSLSRLSSCSPLDTELKNIKNILDTFFLKLVAIDQSSFLIKFIRGIGLQGKKENWEKDLCLLVQAAQAGTKEDPVDDTVLVDFRAIIDILIGEVKKTTKQFFMDYHVNKNILTKLEMARMASDYHIGRFQEEKAEKARQAAEEQIRMKEAIARVKEENAKQLGEKEREKKEAEKKAEEAEKKAEEAEKKAEEAQKKMKEMEAQLAEMKAALAATQEKKGESAVVQGSSNNFFKPESPVIRQSIKRIPPSVNKENENIGVFMPS